MQREALFTKPAEPEPKIVGSVPLPGVGPPGEGTRPTDRWLVNFLFLWQKLIE
jgi:hypothetical protein